MERVAMNNLELILKVSIAGDPKDITHILDLIVSGAKARGEAELLEQLHFAGYTY